MNTHVIKVGGENASDARTAEWLSQAASKGDHIVVAISALRTKPLNTTNELLKAQEAYRSGGMGLALPILENLFRVHLDTLREAGMYDNELEDKLRSLFQNYFPSDLSFPADLHKQHPEIAEEQCFVGYGEVMSAEVLVHQLNTRIQVAAQLINHRVHLSESDNRSLSKILRDEVGARVHMGLSEGIVVVPGYISVRGKSMLESYGRGYTDKMAERIAVGLRDNHHSPVLHIQKQVPLYSSNPNERNVVPIHHLSYGSAAEITGARGANARVLNEYTISRDLEKNKVPVWVYNPFEPFGPKSVISTYGNREPKVLFVDGRDHVSTITVSGFAMSGPGLLARLTNIFDEQGISVDSISSSETEVTFTVYEAMSEFEKTALGEILHRSLGDEFDVTVKNNLGLIYCIGDNLSGNPGLLGKIGTTLAEAGIDIECITQSRGQRAVTIGVSSENLRKGVNSLHASLIDEHN